MFKISKSGLCLTGYAVVAHHHYNLRAPVRLELIITNPFFICNRGDQPVQPMSVPTSLAQPAAQMVVIGEMRKKIFFFF